MELINKGSQHNNKDIEGTIGLYKARVEDNIDPLHLGRVRIRIPTFHGIPGTSNCIPLEGLPWASYGLGGGGYDHGSFIIPEIGDYIYVGFEAGDNTKPVYLGGGYGVGSTYPKYYGRTEESSDYNPDRVWMAPPGVVETVKEGVTENSDPTVRVLYKSIKGSTILIDDTTGNECIKIFTKTGQEFILSESSNEMSLINGSTKLSITPEGVNIEGSLSVTGTITNSVNTK